MRLKASPGRADRLAMEPWLSKALWRAGTKLTLGLAVLGALVGIRIVTVTPAGVEGDLAELERLEAELAAEGAGGEPSHEVGADSEAAFAGESAPGPETTGSPAPADPADIDRLVRCHGGQGVQFMRAADCAMRGGALEELPPPDPEDAPSASSR
jgi:hypothetical protein